MDIDTLFEYVAGGVTELDRTQYVGFALQIAQAITKVSALATDAFFAVSTLYVDQEKKQLRHQLSPAIIGRLTAKFNDQVYIAGGVYKAQTDTNLAIKFIAGAKQNA